MTTDGTTPDPTKIPQDWFFTVGGDKDIRGFGRNTLPSEILGAGSVATWGFESRWPHLISFPLEPLVFTDFGYLGAGNLRFRPELYLAPGIGFRSATPIGTIRATLARGMIPALSYSHFQFFVSFGAEF
jgi:outer membrane translocation and assembly module TamA